MEKILNSICQLVHQRKFKDAEKELLNFIEETLHNSRNSLQITDKKMICETIYSSFNRYYLKWLKMNKINIEKERSKLMSYEHSNYLISRCTKTDEMDDLLFDLAKYLDFAIHKDEVVFGLDCYKRNLSD